MRLAALTVGLFVACAGPGSAVRPTEGRADEPIATTHPGPCTAQVDGDGDGSTDMVRRFSYGEAGYLTLQEVDVGPDGSVDRLIEYTVDESGRVSTEAVHWRGTLQETRRHTYDESGARTLSEWWEGETVTTRIVYRYDGTGQLIGEDWAYGEDLEPAETRILAYDSDGRLTTRTAHSHFGDSTEVTTYVYDEAGNVIREDLSTETGPVYSSTIYAYDCWVSGSPEPE